MDKKEYDRQYMQGKYDQYKAQRRAALQELFGGVCFLCGSSDNFESFQLHHREYHPEESNYNRSGDDMATRVRRLKEAIAHPERFSLLCHPCHRIVGTLGRELKRLRRKKIDLDRLVELIRQEADNRTD